MSIVAKNLEELWKVIAGDDLSNKYLVDDLKEKVEKYVKKLEDKYYSTYRISWVSTEGEGEYAITEFLDSIYEDKKPTESWESLKGEEFYKLYYEKDSVIVMINIPGMEDFIIFK